ncbi:MAG: GatB/YqeY domain-containing protein [Geminicoccaceae bacterium]|nr:MAG: GatB/YqeY domain-containing protein [Geminicoccaceae bacterium]
MRADASMHDGIRDRLQVRLREAERHEDDCAASTLRLILTAIRDRDRAAESRGSEPVGDGAIHDMLVEMVQQRKAEIDRCERCGQLELADREAREIATIEAFLPKRLEKKDIAKAVDAAIAEVHAVELRDAGRVMSVLKARHAGELDLQAAKRMLTERLH